MAPLPSHIRHTTTKCLKVSQFSDVAICVEFPNSRHAAAVSDLLFEAFLGNWFEDRFLEAEGTAVDPVLRPFSGPEEPLVGPTKGMQEILCVFSYHIP